MKTKLLKKIRKRYKIKLNTNSCVVFDLYNEEVKKFDYRTVMCDYLFTQNVRFLYWSRLESLEVTKFVLKRRNRIIFSRMLRNANL